MRREKFSGKTRLAFPIIRVALNLIRSSAWAVNIVKTTSKTGKPIYRLIQEKSLPVIKSWLKLNGTVNELSIAVDVKRVDIISRIIIVVTMMEVFVKETEDNLVYQSIRQVWQRTITLEIILQEMRESNSFMKTDISQSLKIKSACGHVVITIWL